MIGPTSQPPRTVSQLLGRLVFPSSESGQLLQSDAGVRFLSKPTPEGLYSGSVRHLFPLQQPDKIHACSRGSRQVQERCFLLLVPLSQGGVLLELVYPSFEIAFSGILFRPKTELLQLDPSLLLAVPALVFRSQSRGRRGRSAPERVASSTAVSALTPFPSRFFLEEYLRICLHACGHNCSIQRRSNTAATSVTTVALSVCYGGTKPFGPWDTSDFVPCG